MSSKTRPCAVCGQLLSPERIAAAPSTRLCLEHARQIRKYGGEFRVYANVERTSKRESIKRNYGGVTPVMSRNYEAIERLRQDYLDEQEARQS
jgi:hypothetical protein